MLHPAIVVSQSAMIHGQGLIALWPIAAGEVVWRLDPEAKRIPCAEVKTWSAEQLAVFRFVGFQCCAEDYAVCEGPDRYMNHSCDPNTWWIDSDTMVARRDIAPGDEVTADYSTSEIAVDFALTCRCGSPLCRGLVTNNDYLDPAWQERYGSHLPAHALQAIALARARQQV
jgi:uncharacterized protein